MNKDLDELFSQADKQLQDLEAESREKESAKPIDQEVDRETSLHFNQSSIEQQSYAARHPYHAWFLIALVPLFAMKMYWAFTAPRATGPYHLVTGTVRSSSAIWSGRHYGTVFASEVALPDGRVLSIRVDSGRFLHAGTVVSLRVYDTGAVVPDRML
ncbi:hypothetical protein GCM10008098_28970 [Rhodanobacter panaciterrae]|uniref:HlyD family secretion protein n=1 Tax=Rhodanobacter panaciterrae TaxID=490572 RepID=A0ABQ3A6I1_9GAMM|nr:hypothetical protein [Rhodanobacter panaciterrae]GGY33821.1 hypothetical protein GCM10008098_28970 [Rhodanobacter panaciterrae]